MESLGLAAGGFASAAASLNAVSGNLAASDGNLVEEVVQLVAARHTAAAGAAVIRNVDRSLGHVLDILK